MEVTERTEPNCAVENTKKSDLNYVKIEEI